MEHSCYDITKIEELSRKSLKVRILVRLYFNLTYRPRK